MVDKNMFEALTFEELTTVNGGAASNDEGVFYLLGELLGRIARAITDVWTSAASPIPGAGGRL